MMIIHILVDTSHVELQDEYIEYINVTVDIIILYDQHKYIYIYFYKFIMFKHLIQTFKYINYDIS